MFSRIIRFYLENKGINYHVFVINQDNAKEFNRGTLLNIGFKHAKKAKCDYVVFHDVDMLPEQVDYSYSEKPLHMSTNFIINDDTHREVFDEYFGGVTMFNVEDFEKINGFSNKYWGWGYEDTDLLHRCRKHNLDLNILKIENKKNISKGLKFNGINSYVKGVNNFNLNGDISFFVSFYPDKMIYNQYEEKDDFNVFAIPGYDFAISYNSFNRYNFCTFDKLNNALYINSNIKQNYKTNICVTLSNTDKKIIVYQDGIKIGEVKFDNIYDYSNEKFFYLGSGSPKKGDSNKFFKGLIDSFASWDKVLNENEILDISNNTDKLLNTNFCDYNSSEFLNVYYDGSNIDKYQFIDLTNKGNNGEINKCEIVDINMEPYEEIKIPHRRTSTFRLLPHTENGFFENKWKNQITRWNQLRFNNEVLNNDKLIYEDGLSTLNYTIHGTHIIDKNITHINVGI